MNKSNRQEFCLKNNKSDLSKITCGFFCRAFAFRCTLLHSMAQFNAKLTDAYCLDGVKTVIVHNL